MSSKKFARHQAIMRVAASVPLDLGQGLAISPVEDIFGSLVFGKEEMQKRLPHAVWQVFERTIQYGAALDVSLADVMAAAMRDWALEHGATHYSHWFQPMTGTTAEKHDAFLDWVAEGEVLSLFSGKTLIKGESDASSFPSGGIRSTFEARGYTAWDPRSPVFLKEHPTGRTLCIPTVFCSYTGECLDRKTPLLRSMQCLSTQALRLLRLFGDVESTHVHATLGAEQEYFLIDRNFFLLRPDLVNAGRTLYGAKPPKGQEMSDHYYGAVPARVLAFMTDAEAQLYRLGVPVKTRHNEAAPAQFELAPLFENANIATDHNMLIMEVLSTTARKHGFFCLLHEKPFKGVNGSGKHCNWSLSDSAGNNLLEPGDTPLDNAQFLVFLAAVLRAVHLHAPMLRLGTVCSGNDHRLGAHEAPPAIVSVFLGTQLEAVVDSIVNNTPLAGQQGTEMRVGVTSLPPLPRDATDRNRTSPFAFTGNKFEFRAVGSSQSTAPAVFMINVAVSHAIDYIATQLEKALAGGQPLHEAVQELLRRLFAEHMPVVFNGDSYRAEWLEEATRRGLPNLVDTVSALERFTDLDVVSVLEQYGVLSSREIYARQDILFNSYATSIHIEGQVALSIGRTMLLPAAIEYQGTFATSLARMQTVLHDASPVQIAALQALTVHIDAFIVALDALDAALLGYSDNQDSNESARYCRDRIIPLMENCRAQGDALESLVDDTVWPLPKYRELLWIY